MEEELRYTGWEWVLAEEEAFWRAALAEDVCRIAWISRRSAPEYCGFLEWLWRLGDLACEVIDLTDMPVGSRHRAFSLTACGIALSRWTRPPVRDTTVYGAGSVPRTRLCAVSTLRVFDPRRSPSLTNSCSPSPKPGGKNLRGSSARQWRS